MGTLTLSPTLRIEMASDGLTVTDVSIQQPSFDGLANLTYDGEEEFCFKDT
jgi:hypothetical protein